MKTNN